MAALTIALLLAASIDLDVAGCGATVDAAALRRLVALDWAAPPAGTKVTITCESATLWRLELAAPGLIGSIEQLELPALSGPARTRVLALIVTERGRAFTNAPPEAPPLPEEPHLPPPLLESVRSPIVPRSEPPQPEVARVVAPQPGSPLRDGLIVFGSVTEPSRRWRLSVAGAAVRPTWLQPWRFGPEVKVHGGPFALALSTTVGAASTDLGNITVLALTAEPELTVACAGGQRWRACAAARGVLGYGSVFASPRGPDVVGVRQDGPLLGGAGVIGGSLELVEWLALDADVRAGWAWGVYGSEAGVPVVAVGGGFFAASLALVASWGSP